MKQVVAIKLQPTPEQAAVLLATVARFNTACDAIAAVAFSSRTASKFAVQRLVYADTRARFGLSAQMTIRAIAKVCEAYRRNKDTLPRFRPLGAMPYDERIMSWHEAGIVSLLTLCGRLKIPFVCGAYQAARIERVRGQADLVLRDGRWYLYATIEVPTPPVQAPAGWLGVDLGIRNIAADSDGAIYSGAHVSSLRHRHRHLRRRLQAKGTKGSRRLLRHRRRKERRFGRHVNHTISKRIVAVAQDTVRGIALENLTHIRARVTVRRSQRAAMHSWSFFQLRQFVTYKAQMVGVSVALVDPRNTSRTCPACGHCEMANRVNQALFSCRRCGLAGSADHFAAINIGRRAAVNPPYCSDANTSLVAPGQSQGQ